MLLGSLRYHDGGQRKQHGAQIKSLEKVQVKRKEDTFCSRFLRSE